MFRKRELSRLAPNVLSMPKLTNSLPKYREHSSGNARVTISGRDYLLGPYGTKASNLEYDRSIAEYLASGRSQPAPPRL